MDCILLNGKAGHTLAHSEWISQLLLLSTSVKTYGEAVLSQGLFDFFSMVDW